MELWNGCDVEVAGNGFIALNRIKNCKELQPVPENKPPVMNYRLNKLSFLKINCMRLVAAFIRMTRPLNLFFIAITQLLFHQFIIHPVLGKVGQYPVIDGLNYVLLTAASVLIAAAGYIINDYFDINIDLVNKPRGNVVDSIISRRWAIAWHFALSFTGVLCSAYVSWKTGLWFIVIINTACVALLFGYSVSLKRKLLSGNILISVLTAWVIMVITLSEFDFITANTPLLRWAYNKILQLGILYSGFAFIMSLIREAVKDVEDMNGDARYGCKTMPITWGVNVTKVYVAVWLIVLIAVLVILQFYVIPLGWGLPVIYSVGLIIIPLVYFLFKLYKSRTEKDFHFLSNLAKFIMLTGILSMIFFKYYL
jgi:4-hydroxybenzoate polyprenyltransferase